jgi:hypothetical protein
MRRLLLLGLLVASLPISGCGAKDEAADHTAPENFSKSENPEFAPPAGKNPEGASRSAGGK